MTGPHYTATTEAEQEEEEEAEEENTVADLKTDSVGETLMKLPDKSGDFK